VPARELLFYYDVVCPFAYLASRRVEALAQRVGARVDWRPILLGGVFRSIGSPDQPSAAMPPEKLRMNALDLMRWAAFHDVPLCIPPGHPRRSVEAMRLLSATSGELLRELSQALFEAYWVDGADLADAAVLARVAEAKAGLAPWYTREVLADDAVKHKLRQSTAEAVARGVFGVPSFVVDGQLVWGQDRMDHVERLLGGQPAALPRAGGALDFWFELGSPYAYLAATQLDQLGADVRWRPVLLGAVFKRLGYPANPMDRYPAVKQAYFKADFQRAARHLGIALRLPSRFPASTLLAMRMLLAAPAADLPRLAIALFEAYWVHDADPGDPGAMAAVADRVGLDGAALVARAADPAVKQALIDSTQAAIDGGVFGAPFFRVGDQWFWGHDRLALVARALGGWRVDAPDRLHLL